MNTELHPWLSTPEAAACARKAVQIPLNLLPELARRAGEDELYSEALTILTECALPPRNQAPTGCGQCGRSLEVIHRGVRFCSRACRIAGPSTPPAPPAPPAPAHIGSMWSWPEAERQRYAACEIGYALCNWLRTRKP